MDYKNGLVSIVMPVYNREAYIVECLESVFSQSYQNFEIIIVDDGSTDGTYSLCEALAEKDDRVKLFKASHGGVSAARNVTLEKASGEYVFFLDSDDVIHPFLLEALVLGMKENNAKIGATDVARARADSWHKVRERLAAADGAYDVVSLTDDEIIESTLGGNGSPLGCIGGTMMRRDLIGDTKFRTDLYIGEDFLFIYENIIKGAPGVFLKQKWYYVRNHNSNISWDYSFEGFYTRFLRRKLVWESEEALGRKKYANIQKNDALGCAVLCLEKNKPYSEDESKIRKVLKEHRKIIYPALKCNRRIMYIMHCYFPLTAQLVLKTRKKLTSKNKDVKHENSI